jgi:phosphoglycolate phosphatase-like HAD superfamily hydrolase
MQPFSTYNTIVFDCDGVILNSNQLKIQAYFDTAIRFGASNAQAQALVDHHVALGGISRYPKFQYFLKEIMHHPVTEEATQGLLDTFGTEVERLLANCEMASGLQTLRESNPNQRWMVLSGGDQTELRKIFELRGLTHLFNAGIFGSPENKDVVLARELANGNITQPALFLGDSRYDHQASTGAGLDFVFLSAWTDVNGWQAYCQQHQIIVKNNIADVAE